MSFVLALRGEHHFTAFSPTCTAMYQPRGRGVFMYREQKVLCSYRTLLQTLTNMLMIVGKWQGGRGCTGGVGGSGGVQVSSAVNRPHQRGPQIKSLYYSWLSHLRDPANITRLTQLFAISKCVIHYKRFLTLI